MLLESDEPVELPPAEINIDGVTLEREDFRPHVDQLLEALRAGVTAVPAPVVMSDSVFVIEGTSRTFWIRVWHTDLQKRSSTDCTSSVVCPGSPDSNCLTSASSLIVGSDNHELRSVVL
jgi:hypothetical protein